jgi:hypothetical protein
MTPGATLSAEDLEIREAAVSDSTPEDQGDGTVLVHVIRPCIGKGRGRHLYTAEMLEANATKFKDWPMYVDHQSPAARRAAQGLPRSLADVGGWIEESWWDPTVPEDREKGFGAGAVVARATPFGLAEALIKRNPKIVKTSISADATGKRPHTMPDGQKVLMVEGIADGGSVDWVTEAGAGGEIVSLMESVFEEFSNEANSLLEAMDDETFMAYLDRERPQLREALSSDIPNANTGGENMAEITAEMLQEALQSEAVKGLLDERVKAQVKAEIDEQLPALVEARVADERDVIRAEAEATATRQVEIRDMRDDAHKLIAEAKLPDKWKDSLRSEFNIQESGEPTTHLDVVDELDDDGKVTKSARAKLRESVAAKISERSDILQEARAQANPTRVRGQGVTRSSTLQEGATGAERGAESEGEKKKPEGESLQETRYAGTLVGSLLQESGFDPAKGDPWASIR